MYSPRPMALLVCLFLLCAASASAQVRLGVYNSIKGLGLSTEIISKSNSSESDNFTIYADSYGIFAGNMLSAAKGITDKQSKQAS